MISERDALSLLVEYHDHIAVPPAPVEEDLRRGRRRVRRNRALLAGGAALALVAAVVGVSLASGQRMAEPAPPARSPSVPTPSAPTSTATVTVSLESVAPLRSGGSWPPVAMGRETQAEADSQSRFLVRDPRDAQLGAVDIETVRVERFGGDSRMDWWLQLREGIPAAGAAGRVVEYGVVLDTDGDRVADCQIGVSDSGDGPIRSWVTNLRTGRTEAEDGPPYGRLVDFSYPGEGARPGAGEEERDMRFFFLFNTTGPCAGYGGRSSFYSWAAVQVDGRLAEVDYAPDTAWLKMPD